MFRRSNLLAILLLFLCLPGARPQVVHVWDLRDVGQPGQLTIYNPDSEDTEFGTPVWSGDLNGDGLDDIVLSAMAADYLVRLAVAAQPVAVARRVVLLR